MNLGIGLCKVAAKAWAPIMVGHGDVELAAAHGGMQVTGSLVASSSRTRTATAGWARQSWLSVPWDFGRSAWADGTLVRGAPSIREEGVRSQRAISKQTIR
jgi:hypothetical protein